MNLKLSILDDTFTIHRFRPNREIPDRVFEGEFYSISRTDEELSIVCSSSMILESENSETGWSCIKIPGPLDFSLTGVLSGLSKVLADAGISIFAVSTFDTDYILIKSEKLRAAQAALEKAGYRF